MRLYGAWSVTLPGEEYTWEPDLMTGPDCYGVEQQLVGTPWEAFDDWVQDGIAKAKWVPCQTLIWFLRYKNGQPSDRIDIVFPLRQLKITELKSGPKAGTGRSATSGSRRSRASGSAPATSTS